MMGRSTSAQVEGAAVSRYLIGWLLADRAAASRDARCLRPVASSHTYENGRTPERLATTTDVPAIGFTLAGVAPTLLMAFRPHRIRGSREEILDAR